MPFAQLIATDGVRLNRNDTVLAISADWRPEWASALQQMQRRGVNSIAVLVDGSTFGSPAKYEGVQAEFEATGIPTYILRRGDPLEAALRTPLRGGNYRRTRCGVAFQHKGTKTTKKNCKNSNSNSLSQSTQSLAKKRKGQPKQEKQRQLPIAKSAKFGEEAASKKGNCT